LPPGEADRHDPDRGDPAADDAYPDARPWPRREVDGRRAHQRNDQPSGRADPQDEQVRGGVRTHGAPVFVAVAEPERRAERDQQRQRQASARRHQQTEHHERGAVEYVHRRQR
jgi:hypothetical protein